MEEDTIKDSKIYELAMDDKKHTEERRDEINKNYTSIFTGIVAAMPFVNNFIELESKADHYYYTIRFLQILLPLIGLTLSISWIFALKRIYDYLEALDKFLISMEKKHNKSFVTYLSAFLYKNDSPDRVTKQVMWTPYIFTLVFILSLIYFVIEIIAQR